MPNLLLHCDDYGDARESALGRELRFDATADAAARALASDLYVVVATFEGDPWDAYRDTQNGLVSPHWSRAPPSGIWPVGDGTVATPRGPYGLRSTSDGDAVVVDGVLSVLTRRGFEAVDAPLPALIRAVDGSVVEMAPAPSPPT